MRNGHSTRTARDGVRLQQPRPRTRAGHRRGRRQTGRGRSGKEGAPARLRPKAERRCPQVGKTATCRRAAVGGGRWSRRGQWGRPGRARSGCVRAVVRAAQRGSRAQGRLVTQTVHVTFTDAPSTRQNTLAPGRTPGLGPTRGGRGPQDWRRRAPAPPPRRPATAALPRSHATGPRPAPSGLVLTLSPVPPSSLTAPPTAAPRPLARLVEPAGTPHAERTQRPRPGRAVRPRPVGAQSAGRMSTPQRRCTAPLAASPLPPSPSA